MTANSIFFHNTETAALLCELHSSCFSKPWNEKAFTDLLSNRGTISQILEVDEKPIGFSLYQLAADEAEILTFGVLPEERRRAHGQTLLHHAEAHLKKQNIVRIILEVSTANVSAQHLYKKCGFKKAAIRKNYYHENGGYVDAILMDKKLT